VTSDGRILARQSIAFPELKDELLWRPTTSLLTRVALGCRTLLVGWTIEGPIGAALTQPGPLNTPNATSQRADAGTDDERRDRGPPRRPLPYSSS